MNVLAELLSPVRHILLDFDGPICSLFAGLPAPDVSSRMRSALASLSGELLPQWESEGDPLALLRRIADDEPKLVPDADDVLGRLELEAVRVAKPTPHSEFVLKACAATGRMAWVVSNNNSSAIWSYLEQRSVNQYVSGVFGRISGVPDSMKPDPRLVKSALRAAFAGSENSILIGDAVRDVQAANAAHVRTIGYANKPGKEQRLTEAGAVAVVTSMSTIAEALYTSA